jgi:hypothetical protein
VTVPLDHHVPVHNQTHGKMSWCNRHKHKANANQHNSNYGQACNAALPSHSAKREQSHTPAANAVHSLAPLLEGARVRCTEARHVAAVRRVACEGVVRRDSRSAADPRAAQLQHRAAGRIPGDVVNEGTVANGHKGRGGHAERAAAARRRCPQSGRH